MGLGMRKSPSPHKTINGSPMPASAPPAALAQELKDQSSRGKILPLAILVALALCVIAFVGTAVSLGLESNLIERRRLLYLPKRPGFAPVKPMHCSDTYYSA